MVDVQQYKSLTEMGRVTAKEVPSSAASALDSSLPWVSHCFECRCL